MISAFDAYQILLAYIQEGVLPDLLKEEGQYLAMCAYVRILNDAGFDDVRAMEGNFTYDAKSGGKSHMALFGLTIEQGDDDIFVGLHGTVGEVQAAQKRLGESSVAADVSRVKISRLDSASIPVDQYLKMHANDCIAYKREDTTQKFIGKGVALLQAAQLQSIKAASATHKRVRL